MKLFITGEPHSGKSTLMSKVIEAISPAQGFVTREVAPGGVRTGFELVSASGDRALLAGVDVQSDVRVSRYGVDVAALDAFIARLPEPQEGEFIYVDEVGQMELYSENFKKLVERYLSLPNPFIGTLTSVYEDDFTRQLKARSDVEILNITVENRDAMFAEIVERISRFTHSQRHE